MGKIFKALEKSEQGLSGCQEKAENRNPRETLVAQQSADPFEGEGEKVPATKKNEGSNALNGAHQNLETFSRPYSGISEQFRLLKTNILFPEKGEPPRTIMVTSPSPGEGKSFIAANLAISMAQSIDEYVLLLDCDLRAPTVHSLFGLDGKKTEGLSEYLSGSVPLKTVLKKTFIPKLTILPGGKIPSNPSELLSSEQMRRMLHEMKLRYADRYIIIDTPPPYITSETNAIARFVDSIIIVVRQGKTRIKEVQDIVDIYGKEKILGVIQNFSKKSLGYGYGYYKYGYHKYRYGHHK